MYGMTLFEWEQRHINSQSTQLFRLWAAIVATYRTARPALQRTAIRRGAYTSGGSTLLSSINAQSWRMPAYPLGGVTEGHHVEP